MCNIFQNITHMDKLWYNKGKFISEDIKMFAKDKIKEIEQKNNSKVISYLTNDNTIFTADIQDNIYLPFNDILKNIGSQSRIDLFLYSRGGNTLVPWKLVNMIREYTDYLTVLIPYHANSSATLISIGANKIIMGRLADISPIDPTLTTPFNPSIPGREMDLRSRLGISVEDIMSYYELAKNTMRLKEEASLLKAFELLSTNVQPIALGAIHRSYNQIRILAHKLLGLHLDEQKDYLLINKIIENLTEKLYNHGHMINRKEAKEILSSDLIEIPDMQLETYIWDLFEIYEKHMKMNEQFDFRGVGNKFQLFYDQASVNTIQPYIEKGVTVIIESSDIRYEYQKEISFQPVIEAVQGVNTILYKNINIVKNEYNLGWIKV